MTLAATNEPRFDHNPSTLQPRGLLIEGARTNALTNSNDMSNAIWLKTDYGSGGGVPVVTLESGTAGTLDAVWKVVFPTVAAPNQSALENSHAIGGAITCTASIEIMADAPCTLVFRSQASENNINVTTSWQRLSSLGSAMTIRTFALKIRPASGTSTTATIYIRRAQIEEGSFASSYIHTTTAAATRAADVATITTLSSIGYNQSEGVVFPEFVLQGLNTSTTTGARVFQLHDGTVNNRFGIVSLGGVTDNGDVVVAMTTGGVAQWGTSGTKIITGPSVNTIYKTPFAYQANNLAACVNGGSLTTQGTASIPTVNGMGIGNNGYDNTQPFFGWMRRLVYYPSRLPNATLQSLSA